MPNSITAAPLKYPPIQRTTAPEPLPPTPREQELEAQNKALWELVQDLKQKVAMLNNK